MENHETNATYPTALLVAFEGIDGSGKGTQARRLQEHLAAQGRKAALISFPRYEETLFGRAVGEFLNGRFGSLDEVDPFLVSLLYAGDRFESRGWLTDALAENDVVVLDRYVASNIAHQGAKRNGDARDELIDRIQKIEYGLYQLPRPNLVLLLDLPVAEAQKLIAVKSARSYTDRKADLQEADADYLQRVRDVYLSLADNHPDWYRIDSVRGDTLRTVEEIAGEIVERLTPLLKA